MSRHGLLQRRACRLLGVDEVLPNEQGLCTLLNVSRTVLREGIKTLAAKGLVETRTKVGTRVPVALAQMLPLAAFGFALAALIRQEPVPAGWLTAWDAAAAPLALGIASGWLVDLEAVRALVEAETASTAAGVSRDRLAIRPT